LVAPLARRLPKGSEIVEAGALDGITTAALPAIQDAAYPLTTQMRDGQRVTVGDSFLAARLQRTLQQLEAQGVHATILLCAGTFSELTGSRPLFKPFAIGRTVLASLGLKRIGFVAPIIEQEAPIRQRWQEAGFEPTVWTSDLAQQDEQFHRRVSDHIDAYELECILLDYVGHPESLVKQLKTAATIPVLDLGQLAMDALASVL
jgi:hypothetical protein